MLPGALSVGKKWMALLNPSINGTLLFTSFSFVFFLNIASENFVSCEYNSVPYSTVCLN